MTERDTLAVLVGGGPAPGLNGVIASAGLAALARGVRVVGILDGYKPLVAGDVDAIRELGADELERIATTGGSIVRTSRTNPARDEATLSKCVETLERLSIRYLVCIGGDDTTYGATQIAAHAKGRIGVVSVPKTIDNDLPLPGNAPTFGFETARAVGAGLVENLIEDARTTRRWYLCISMGRTAGALALGMCRGSGATLAVIPEELDDEPGRFRLVADIVVGAMLKRRALGHDDGVAIVGEGVAEHLSDEDLTALPNLPRDTYGQIRLADVPIGLTLRDMIRERLRDLGVAIDVVPKDIGYELRCAKPVAFDIAYTRALGAAAVRYLLDGGSGSLITLDAEGVVIPLDLSALRDPATGRVRVRRVDVDGEAYRAARAAMTRLEPDDLVEPMRSQLAALTNRAPERFAEEFARATRRR
jgi:6-phosphofructokinase 1